MAQTTLSVCYLSKLLRHLVLLGCCPLSLAGGGSSECPYDLRVGVAGHAFDHLGNIGEQADAAAASGSTIIYTTGVGASGYQGLPKPAEMAQARTDISDYLRRAKTRGIRLAIGYMCATSIVKL